ncbi:MAG TPA: hypothetical protein VHM90_03115, partial [Phycisphaerae bacterium]|nr:hypothetical protein [Phycisphaerae bacterium]
VDYEFAQRTHFFALDAWRWRRFAGSGVRGHGLAPELPAPPAWLEALGILQHMVMLHAIHPGSAAYADCLLCVRELFAALTRGHARFRGEMLLRHLVTSQDFRPVGQLFWSSDGVFSEPCSACLSYEPESGTVLRFTIGAHHGPLHLRFDPADRAGLIAISAARIIRESDGVRLVDRDATQIAETSAAAGDILLLEPTGSANYLSLGPDPQLRLHPFDLGGEPQSLRCEIDLRFSHGLAPLATLLPRDQASLLTARRETEKLQCRIAEMQLRHDELVQSLHAQNEALLDHEHRNRRAAAERASLQEELQEARHRIGDLDAVIVSKVEQIAVALDRANMFDQKLAAATAELEHIRAQLAASQALLQRFARLEKRALVRFDHLVRGEKPLSRQIRVP